MRRFLSRCLHFLVVASLLVITPTSFAQSPDGSLSETPENPPSATAPRWAMVIHGGAGGEPAKWSEAKRQARRDGLEAALKIGREHLAGGGLALQAVERVIRSLEDNPHFNAGRGAVVTSEGTAELDASIMDGRTRACGGIAGVRTVKNPISTARLVMTDTRHVLLVGAGADAFAAAKQVELVKPEYFLSRRVPNEPGQSAERYLGTVGCVALDTAGNLAAGTSTGGTAKKLPGRVGDSPIVGAGTFADNSTCAVSGTGVGEEYIRNVVAYDIAAQMRYAHRSLEAAVTRVMTQTLQPGIGGLICVSREGDIAMQHNTPGMSCAAADSQGRFEIHLELEGGGRDAAASPARDVDEMEIEKLLHQQAAGWNAGRIDQFMDAYWKDARLTFSSSGNITRGWQATLDRYRQRYPDKDTMGQVAFTDLEYLRLDRDAMQVLGVWELKRKSGLMGGRFTLIFRKQPEGWRIVHDHTSLSTEE